MHLMFGDEADHEAGRAKFIVYGGLIVESAQATVLSGRIAEIRRQYGFQPGDPLKFATRSRPPHVTANQHTDAKQQVLAAALEVGAVFTAYAALHALIVNREAEDRVKFAANTVLGSYNRYLERADSYGIALMDRMPLEHEHRYFHEKFQQGLVMPDGRAVALDRILAFAATSDGASHLSSVADIVLGSFRYCVNEPERDVAGRALYPQVARLLWTVQHQGQARFEGWGLNLRPMRVTRADHQSEYDELRARLQGYLG